MKTMNGLAPRAEMRSVRSVAAVSQICILHSLNNDSAARWQSYSVMVKLNNRHKSAGHES